MKNSFLIACAVALLSACSSPSYYLMSAKKSAYHGENYKVAAAPVAARPDDAAPLEASAENTPALLPPAYSQKPAENTTPVSVPVQRSQQPQQQAPVSAPQTQLPAAEEKTPETRQPKKIKKAGPNKLIKMLTSNTRLAIIFLIVGLIVWLLLNYMLIGAILIIIGVVLLIA